MKKILPLLASTIPTFLLLFLTLVPFVEAFQIKNHLAVDLDNNPIATLLLLVLQVIIIIMTPIITLFIIYAGFMYVTARGNVEQTQQATRTLIYAIVGGVMILGAVAASGIIENLVNAFIRPE